jgi:TRAP-type C4-dicarboxylate transport system permease small subunit
MALVTTVVGLAFCIVLFVLSVLYWHEAWAGNWRSDTVWRARLWIPYASMPIGLGLLVLEYVAELIRLVTGRTPPYGIDPQRLMK